MKVEQLEHILRAASHIVRETEFIVVGSQSILGTYPEAEGILALSIDADLYPLAHPEKALELSDQIGEESHFHHSHGVYADGVSPNVPVLPEGWEQRLVRLQNENTGGAVGWCLDPIDLAVSKYVAERPKDIEFLLEMMRRDMIDPDTFSRRLDVTPIDEERQLRIARLFGKHRGMVDRERSERGQGRD